MADSTNNAGPHAKRIRVAFWGLSVAWSCVIFWVSSQPGSNLPGGYPPELGHFGEYFILGMLLYGALRADGASTRAILVAIAIASLYGVSDEFHQSFVPMRTPDIADWMTDTVGAACGASLGHSIALTRARRAASAQGGAKSSQ